MLLHYYQFSEAENQFFYFTILLFYKLKQKGSTNMKRLLSCIVSICMAFSLCACGSNSNAASDLPGGSAEPDTSKTKPLIVSNSGMTVTYEECYSMLEDVLSGNTDYMDSEHSFSFVKDDSENIRFMSCDGIDANVMVALMKNGDAPTADEKIDYILITFVGSSSDIQKRIPFFQMCAICAILITHPEIEDADTALQFYKDRMNTDNLGAWISVNGLEYSGDLSSVGSDMYMVSFGIRVADSY